MAQEFQSFHLTKTLLSDLPNTCCNPHEGIQTENLRKEKKSLFRDPSANNL